MKRYRVEFSLEARDDIERSFEWGRITWGDEGAIRWYRKITTFTRKVLAVIPLGQPIAPEGRELERDIRHLVFGRYRILFEVKGNLLRVLHVKGVFAAKQDGDLGVDE